MRRISSTDSVGFLNDGNSTKCFKNNLLKASLERSLEY